MALKPLTEADIDQRQAELQRELLPVADVSYANVEVIKKLAGINRFEYPKGSGIWYGVPRVPYYEGLYMNDVYLRIKEAGKSPTLAQVGVFDVMFRQMIERAWAKLIVPERRKERWLKKLGLARNPLKRMTELELAELLGFFLTRRMMSNVSFHYPAGL